MHLVVSGGRGYSFTQADREFLDRLDEQYAFESVIQGGAKGADACAARWGNDRGIPVTTFSLEWFPRGGPCDRRAGRYRNERMARYVRHLDAVWVFFPGGPGTNHAYSVANMVRQAQTMSAENIQILQLIRSPSDEAGRL